MPNISCQSCGVHCLLTISLVLPSVVAADVEFQRDVQPILAEHCLQCHGVDEAKRQSGLRLDLRDTAIQGGESGQPAISPGAPNASELFRRITSDDGDVVMPPPHLNKPLSKSQIETLQQWIANGADYEAHWAFTRPVKTLLPNVGTNNPVDAFVLDHLQKSGLAASPQASLALQCGLACLAARNLLNNLLKACRRRFTGKSRDFAPRLA